MPKTGAKCERPKRSSKVHFEITCYNGRIIKKITYREVHYNRPFKENVVHVGKKEETFFFHETFELLLRKH